MSDQEPPYLLELVASLCALPLILACRLEGGRVAAPETLAWLALCWAVASATRTHGCWHMRNLSGLLQAKPKQ